MVMIQYNKKSDAELISELLKQTSKNDELMRTLLIEAGIYDENMQITQNYK